jgi:ankyrin repeat protein
MINNISISEQMHYYFYSKNDPFVRRTNSASRLWAGARILKSLPLLPFSLLETLFNGLSYLFSTVFCSSHTKFWEERMVSSFHVLSCQSTILGARYYLRKQYLNCKLFGNSDLEIFIKMTTSPHMRCNPMKLLEKIESLIKENSGRINEKGLDGNTLLHLAIKEKSTVAIQLLLDLGADILAQNQKDVIVWEQLVDWAIFDKDFSLDTLKTLINCTIRKKQEYQTQNTLPQTEHQIALEGIHKLPLDVKSIFLSKLEPHEALTYAQFDPTVQKILHLREIHTHQSARKPLLQLGIYCFLGANADKIEYCEVPWHAREILKLCPNVKEIIFTDAPPYDTIESLKSAFIQEFPSIKVSPLFSKTDDYPLHNAVRTGSRKEIKALLKNKKIFINAEDRSGVGPLIYAILRNDIAIFKLLLKYKADVNRVSRRWARERFPKPANPLDWPFYENIDKEIIDLLEDTLRNDRKS